uniref:Uncharacterized protein n=1 Tax=Setaria viridis TaxID=4556 RepID=A0A4U6TBK3_SETVI|nr:hypothetical protein SEVIR_9G549500v2 [Setaria viridis]
MKKSVSLGGSPLHARLPEAANERISTPRQRPPTSREAAECFDLEGVAELEVGTRSGRELSWAAWACDTYLDIKLIRTDTTLDLSQKAEKGMSYHAGVALLLYALRRPHNSRQAMWY